MRQDKWAPLKCHTFIILSGSLILKRTVPASAAAPCMPKPNAAKKFVKNTLYTKWITEMASTASDKTVESCRGILPVLLILDCESAISAVQTQKFIIIHAYKDLKKCLFLYNFL